MPVGVWACSEMDSTIDRLVLRLALEVFLAVPESGCRLGRQGDPGLGAVLAVPPRPLGGADLTVRVPRGLLAQVPEVAGGVLGVPVGRVLNCDAVLGRQVVDGQGLDPADLLGAVQDRDLVVGDGAVLVALLVNPAVAWLHGPVA